jgi:hypothetical protein
VLAIVSSAFLNAAACSPNTFGPWYFAFVSAGSESNAS